jgi:hypothetical protein
MHTSLISLLKCSVQPPLPLAGEGRGGGEKHEDKSLILKILKTPFLTFPRCAGEGSTGSRYRFQSNGVDRQ